MNRRRRSHALTGAITLVGAVATALGMVGVTPAVAAGITIDYPAAGSTVVPTALSAELDAVVMTGTFSARDGETDLVIAYLDDRLATCEQDFGDSPDGEGGCFYVGGLDGSHWQFQLLPEQFEHLGFEFYADHVIDIVLIAFPEPGQPHVERGRESVAFTISRTPATAEPAPQAKTPAPVQASGRLASDPKASASKLSSGDISAPSVLSATTAAQDVALTPERALLTALVTVILLLIVGFPGALLGSTISDNYDRIFGRLSRRITAWRGKHPGSNRIRAPGRLLIAAGIATATIIAGFVDPGFGFNPGSVRMLVSVGIAFVLESLVGWWLIARILTISDDRIKPRVRFRLGSLAVLTVAVAISRLVGFEPGMVFGLMVGLTFGISLALARKATIALVGSGYAFCLAIFGWAGYSVVLAAGGDERGFWFVFASETLSGLAVSGIASLPLALLPLAVFDGGTLFAWKRWVWALAYGVGLFAFLVILMPLPFSWGQVSTPFATWLTLYLAYAVFAIGLWAWFRFVKPRRVEPTQLA